MRRPTICIECVHHTATIPTCVVVHMCAASEASIMDYVTGQQKMALCASINGGRCPYYKAQVEDKPDVPFDRPTWG